MKNFDIINLVVNTGLVILLIADILYHIYRVGKTKGQDTQPNISVYIVPKSDFQDIKTTANSAEVIKEVTDSLEAITLDKSKKVLLEVSNGVASGFIVKTKFGSS